MCFFFKKNKNKILEYGLLLVCILSSEELIKYEDFKKENTE
jgi:hypothetical protein